MCWRAQHCVHKYVVVSRPVGLDFEGAFLLNTNLDMGCLPARNGMLIYHPSFLEASQL